MDILDLINSAKSGDENSFLELGKLLLKNEEELNNDTIGATVLYFKKAIDGGSIDALIELMKMYEVNYYSDYKFILDNIKNFALNDANSKIEILKYITNKKSKFYSPVVIKFITAGLLNIELESEHKLDLAEILIAEPIEKEYLALQHMQEIDLLELSAPQLFKCLFIFSAGIINGVVATIVIDKTRVNQIIAILEQINEQDVKLKLIKILSSGQDFDKVDYKITDLKKAKLLFDEMTKSKAFDSFELVRIYGAGLTFDNKDLKALRNDKKAKDLLWDIFSLAKDDERYMIAQIFGSGKNSEGINFGIKDEDLCRKCLDKIVTEGAGYDKLEVAKIFGTGYDNDRDYYGFKDKDACIAILNSIKNINVFFQKEVNKILKTGRDSLNNNYGIFEDETFENSTTNILTSFAKTIKEK